MVTIRIKFRPSSVKGKEGTLFFQVIQGRNARQIGTDYRLYTSEWDKYSAQIIYPLVDEGRNDYLQAVEEKIKEDIRRLEGVIARLEKSELPYTSEEVVVAYKLSERKDTFLVFMEGIIEKLRRVGKIRTSEAYTSTLNSFRRFLSEKDIRVEELDSDLMIAYEAYLKEKGVCLNSSSFYMRNLRAVYNRAVEKRITPQRYPFKHVYTGTDKTIKRAVPLKVIRQIKELDLSWNSSAEFARDMFMLSFYLRGTSFVDIAFLKKRDLSGGILSYRRKKTNQQLYIKWKKCMQDIIEKYDIRDSPYLLPIINKPEEHERQQYINRAHLINRKLKKIGELLGLSIPLTMYVARHSWASVAKSKNIPLSVISDSMGHHSEATTQIYLASLDTLAVDKANSLILSLL